MATTNKKLPDGIKPLMLQFVSLTSEFGKRAMEEIERHRSDEKQAEELRPQLLEKLLSAGAIQPHQKQAAEKALQSHSHSLTLLSNAVDRNVELKQAGEREKSASLGQGVNQGSPTKETRKRNPTLGLRTSEKSAADIAFRRRLLGE